MLTNAEHESMVFISNKIVIILNIPNYCRVVEEGLNSWLVRGNLISNPKEGQLFKY